MNGKFASLAIALSLAATPALAAPASPAPASPPPASQVTLKGDVRLEKTVTENGTTRVVVSEPKVVVPGDRLMFSTEYRNEGTQVVTNFVVTNPLPAAVSFADDSGTAAQVSVDGGTTWGALGTLQVADGKGGMRPAVAGDVTHVRWTIATIAPGASGTVRYHAIVR